ncbi:MAG: hypothetical protein OEV74_14530 [Cyclobacteriaceae bacterium]|nr:hypothetical protein [Cyclobacteriaceae bacterium]MDH4297495.1 hypothetical protein [Cyclobacteriaceae bacterium]MDH5248442.1 hypothetical protein [Cyclobacteriaceae bacterium]
MRRLYLLACLILLCIEFATAQDEGVITRKERIDRSNSFFFGFGPSFTLGDNIGDYSVGFNFETGFQKRLNRVLSIGPSISYLSFRYDPDVTSVSGSAYVGNGDPNGWGAKYALPNLNYNYGYVITLEGGNLSLFSFAVNLKLNLVPIKDNSKFSVYGFAKPFITYVTRGEVTGSDVRYTYEIYEDLGSSGSINDDILYYNLGDGTFYQDGYTGNWGPNSYDALKSGTEITGGIFIGPGIEVMPTKVVSIFLQAAFVYTFPVTFVSTQSYEPSIESYLDDNFPMTKKGFPSVNIQLGLSFNF